MSVTGGEGRQHQLALEVRLRDDATLDNFYHSPRNRPLVDALRRQLLPGGEPLIFIHGPPGSGKSHLLQASCHLAGPGALYLPLGDLVPYQPDTVLQAVEQSRLVCLDDLHAVLDRPAWEFSLFEFFNRARDAGCALQFAAEAPPRRLQVGLEDLRSRLAWSAVFQLERPGDHEKAEILRHRAARRGLVLNGEVANFIVNRAPRSLADLLALLDTLDRASLVQQRGLSIPFVKSILGW
jgi:DnaA family protein